MRNRINFDDEDQSCAGFGERSGALFIGEAQRMSSANFCRSPQDSRRWSTWMQDEVRSGWSGERACERALMTRTAAPKTGPPRVAIVGVEVRSFLAAPMAFVDKALPRPAS
jgi:hypothetical protein